MDILFLFIVYVAGFACGRFSKRKPKVRVIDSAELLQKMRAVK